MSETPGKPGLVLAVDEQVRATYKHNLTWADSADWAGQWHGICSQCGATVSVFPPSSAVWGAATEQSCPHADVDRSPEAVAAWQATHSATGIDNTPPDPLPDFSTQETSS